MLTTKSAADRGELPFWDSAAAGEQCGVPCWPSDKNGNAVDCPTETVLVGVIGDDGLLRAEEEVSFNPGLQMWTCDRCSPTGRSFPRPRPPSLDDWRPPEGRDKRRATDIDTAAPTWRSLMIWWRTHRWLWRAWVLMAICVALASWAGWRSRSDASEWYGPVAIGFVVFCGLFGVVLLAAEHGKALERRGSVRKRG